MKKILYVMLILSVILAVSCKSTGTVNDDTYRRIYNKYFSSIILDGASSYTVKSGDRLVDISRAQYNDPYFYPLIMIASRDVVVDPYKIQPGMVLTVPDLNANLNNARAKESIKGAMRDCAVAEDNRNESGTAQGLRNKAASL